MNDEQLAVLAAATAEALTAITSDAWTVTRAPAPVDGAVELSRPDGARVYFSADRSANRPRLSLHGIFPLNETYPRPKSGEIGVAPARGAPVIAKEIVRRLLPVYLPELDRVRADIARRAEDTARRVALAAELAAILPGASARDDERHHQAQVRWHTEASSGHVTIDHDANSGTVEIHRTTPDLMRALLHALAQHPG